MYARWHTASDDLQIRLDDLHLQGWIDPRLLMTAIRHATVALSSAQRFLEDLGYAKEIQHMWFHVIPSRMSA